MTGIPWVIVWPAAPVIISGMGEEAGFPSWPVTPEGVSAPGIATVCPITVPGDDEVICEDWAAAVSVPVAAAEDSGVFAALEEDDAASVEAVLPEAPLVSDWLESAGLIIRTCELKRAPFLSMRFAVMDCILPGELPVRRKVIVAITPDPEMGLVVMTAMRILPALEVFESIKAPVTRLPLATVGLARLALSYDICKSIPATDEKSEPLNS